ncbi:MAG: OmpH family outer membrane protein [Thermodesulfobacteriota bacterium]
MKRRTSIIGLCLTVFAAALLVAAPLRAETKIGVMNIQKIMADSEAGKRAKASLEKKAMELQNSFKAEEDALMALKTEIEKKSSVWSEEKKQEKTREYQKKGRELQTRNEDARFEMQKLQEKELAPMLKTLQDLVTSFGKQQGYTIIFDSKAGVLFSDEAIDVSDQLISELNQKMK